MSTSVTDWSCYLASVCEDYAHWWEKYTLTDVTGRQQPATASKGGGLLLDLMAETLPEKDEGDSQKDKQADKIERFTVLEGLRKYAKEHVLLQGAPGSGKSTAIARLLLAEAGRARDDQLEIPVLVELRYYNQSLQQLIEDSLLRCDPSLDTGELERWLSQGRLLLLLDGVNELPSEAARRDVRRFRRRYEKTTSMVFTTRKLGEGGDLGIGKKLTMQPLSEEQMTNLVQAYLPGQGEAMLTQLGERLREFGAVPLLLWMLCSVYAKNQQQIPVNLGGIFRRFTQQYDNELKQDIPDENKSKILWPEMLQELAFRMMVGSEPTEALVTIPRTEAVDIIRSFCQEAGEQGSLAQAKLWLEDLLKYHLIQLGSTDSIQFRHQLIQEYYAAEKLLNQLPGLSDEVLKWEYLNYLKWTEPLALMAGLVHQEGDALRLVRLAVEVDYALGARQAGAILKKKWQSLSIKKISDVITSQVLQIHLLGKTNSTAAVPGLLSALKDTDSDVRRRAANALVKIGDAAAVSGLLSALKDTDSDVRRRAANALVKIGDAAAVSGLLSALKDSEPEVRRRAAGALGGIGDTTAVSGLLSALKDSDPDVRSNVADALGRIGDTAAIPGLSSALQDDDWYVRRSSTDALGRIGDTAAVPGLSSALQDDDWYVRRSSADALGQIGGAAAVSGLIEALGNPVIEDALKVFEALKKAQGKLGYYRPLPSALMTTREVFISYAWGGESAAPADQLDRVFQSQDINIIRDKKDAGYKANIRDFMQQIGQGKCVLVVISDKYLKSENCMFELVEIANNGDFYDRIFPIVLSDANIYKATARLKYIQYWEQQIEDLETAMKAGGLANLQGITDDLNLYTKIRNSIASLTDTLKNMNTLTPDMHRDSNFETVIEAVKSKLTE